LYDFSNVCANALNIYQKNKKIYKKYRKYRIFSIFSKISRYFTTLPSHHAWLVITHITDVLVSFLTAVVVTVVITITAVKQQPWNGQCQRHSTISQRRNA